MCLDDDSQVNWTPRNGKSYFWNISVLSSPGVLTSPGATSLEGGKMSVRILLIK